MDIRSVIAPVIHDRDGLEQFADALVDRALQIERNVARLKRAPVDRQVVAELFRAVHNIKGDGAFCKFELATAISHPIESMLSRFRQGEIIFSDLLAETMLLAVDRLELATSGLLSGKSLENLRLQPLVLGLVKLADAPADQIDRFCCELIEAVTGFPPVLTALSGNLPRSAPLRENETTVANDLHFFRSLAQQFENRSSLFKGRTTRILRLALETNKTAGVLVDPLQLEAAVYMHDVGMMFLPESVWLKVERITPEDKLALRNHPSYGAGLLQRMPGWEAAAEMVAQHHEMPDGGGYPNGLRHEDISSGAKILSIVDAFEAVMLKHSHRGKNRSVLRAIAEVNACHNQFAPEWIAPFNSVIRRTVEAV